MAPALGSAQIDTQHNASEALPPGTRLHEFDVRGVLGVGGFGIVYLAWDHALEREVALKEYMPVALAGRGEGAKVTLRSPSDSETFATGLRSFVNEARLLARFDHPALVKVHRFWEGNGTAYMVMSFYRGRTLRQMRQSMTLPPDEAVCRHVVDPLLSALELLHREDVFHRDIAPDNILVGDDGTPVLLDFGAARKVITNAQPLTAILKPSFAPLEQYGDVAAMRQGPWTDLYALGATVHYLLTGRAPTPAASRALCDEFVPLAARGSPGCSAGFLEAIDWTLALRPQDRPHDVATLRAALEGRVVAPRELIVPAAAPRATAANDANERVMAPTLALPPSATDFDPTQPVLCTPADAATQAHRSSMWVSTSAAGVEGVRAPDQPATVPIDAGGLASSGDPMPTVPLTQPIGARSASSTKAAKLPARVINDWMWVVRYFTVALLAVVLAATFGSMDLFQNTVLVRRQLTASHLVKFIGYAGALVIIWLLTERAAAQLRDHGGKAAFLHHFLLPLTTLVAVPCAYAALLPVVRPFMGSTLHSLYNWAFVLGTVAAAGWLALSLFQHSDALTASARRAAAGVNGALSSRARDCAACGLANPERAKFCHQCGAALAAVAPLARPASGSAHFG